MKYIQIGDYFKEPSSKLSNYDRDKINELRKTINSYKTVGEQKKFLEMWRNNKDNRIWDNQIFGLHEKAVIDPNGNENKTNKYYSRYKTNIDAYTTFNIGDPSHINDANFYIDSCDNVRDFRYSYLDKSRKEKKAITKEIKKEYKERKKEYAKADDKAVEAELEALEAEKKLKEIEEENRKKRDKENNKNETNNSSDEDQRGNNSEEDNNNQNNTSNGKEESSDSDFDSKDKDNKTELKDDRDSTDVPTTDSQFDKRMRKHKTSNKNNSSGDNDAGSNYGEEAAARAEEEKAREEAKKAKEKAKELREKAEKIKEGAEKAEKAAELSKKASSILPFIITILEVLLVIIVVILIINLIVYLIGGAQAVMGSTPFATCKRANASVGGEIDGGTFAKTIDVDGLEMSIPGNTWQYKDGDEEGDWVNGSEILYKDPSYYQKYEETREISNYHYTEYIGAEENRGVGSYAEEDFAGLTYADGTPLNTETDYIINMRWEYCGFYVQSLNTYQGGIGDVRSPYGDNIQAYVGNLNNDYYSKILQQRVLVVNPANGKSCICMVGNGWSNPNWGPAPSNRLGGLSRAAMDYLEYECGFNSSTYLDAYFIKVDNPESLPTGPYLGSNFSKSQNGCGVGDLNLINTTSIGTLASSLCWPTMDEAFANDGTEAYKTAKDMYAPNVPYARCCATFVSTVLIGAGVMKEENGSPGVIGIYQNTLSNQDEWIEFTPESLDDFQSGDVLMEANIEGGSFKHIAVIGANMPSIANPSIEVCQASFAYGPGGSYDAANAYSAWTSQYSYNLLVSSFNHFYRYIGDNINANEHDLGDPIPGLDDYEYIPNDNRLTKEGGVFQGPSGKETYYNLDMSGCVKIMRNQGFSESDYKVWTRDDGVKMFGRYVMIAADLKLRPRGSLVETSLGTAIVVDTGTFTKDNPTQVDIAVTW